MNVTIVPRRFAGLVVYMIGYGDCLGASIRCWRSKVL